MRYQKQTIEQFDGQVRDWNASLTDVTSPMNHAEYVDGKLITSERTIFGNSIIQGDLTDNGLRSLCYKLDAPHTWLRDKCPEDLKKTIFDRLMRDNEKDHLFRFRNNTEPVCRAVLSDRYMPFNHLDVWEAVIDGVKKSKLGTLQPLVWKPHIDDWMSLWILFEGVSADPDKPFDSYDGGGSGGLKPAIKISNSEDGTGKIRLNGGLYRSYCDNGVIFGFDSKTKIEQIHVGNQSKLVSANIRIAIAETASVAGLGIDKYIESTNEYITGAIDEVVDRWTSKFNIATEIAIEWKGFLGRVNTWGDLVMATADFGGTRKNRDEMETFETMAGDLLYANRSRYVEVRR